MKSLALVAFNSRKNLWQNSIELSTWIKAEKIRPVIAVCEIGLVRNPHLIEGFTWVVPGTTSDMVGFFIPHSLSQRFKVLPRKDPVADMPISSHRLWIKISDIDDRPWYICSVYFPPGEKHRDFVNHLTEQIEHEALQYASGNDAGYIAILGDFNSHVGDFLGPKGKGKPDWTSARVVNLCEALNLFATNLQANTVGEWSREELKENQFERSIIDFILVSEERAAHVRRSQMFDDIDSGSDHKYVLADFKLPEPVHSDRSDLIPLSWNLKRLDSDPILQNLLRMELAFLYQDWFVMAYSPEQQAKPARQQLDELTQVLNNGILCLWHIIVGKHATCNQHSKPWWNSDCDIAFEKKQTCHRALQRAKHRSGGKFTAEVRVAHEKFREARAHFKEIMFEARRQHNHELLAELQEKADKDPRFYSKRLKRLLNKAAPRPVSIHYNGRSESSTEGKTNLMKSYFEDLLNTPPQNANADPEFTARIEAEVEELMRSKEIVPDLDSSVTYKETLQAFKDMAHGKAGGDDQLISEMMEFDIHNFVPLIAKLANQCLESEMIPEFWKTGVIFPIPKPSNDPSAAANFRGITLLSLLGKTIDKIFTNRIQTWLDRNNKRTRYQAGFRPNHSTAHWQYVLRELFDHASHRRIPLYLAFIDIKKAFDTVWFSGLWHKLAHLGMTGKLLRLYKDWYSNGRSAVRVDGRVSDYFPSTQGVKQGAISSPVFYTIFLDDLVKEIEDLNLGYELGAQLLISILLYADDMVLVAKSPNALQKMLDVLESFSNKWHFEINTTKTKIMTLNDEFRRHSWTFNNQPIEEVEEFKYLGIKYSRRVSAPVARWASFMSDKTSATSKSSNGLYGFGAIHHPDWSISTLAALWNVYCRSRAVYGAEIVRASARSLDALSAIQRRYARHLLKLNRHCNNEVVYGELDWLPMDYEFDICKIRFWYDLHTLHESHLARQVYLSRSADPAPSGSWLSEARAAATRYGLTLDAIGHHKNWKGYIREQVRKQYHKDWKQKVDASSRLDLYRQIKCKPQQNPLFKTGPKQAAIIVTRLAASSNALPVDQLRFADNVMGRRVPRQERLCNLCFEATGDEEHLLTSCSHLESSRLEGFKSIIACFQQFNKSALADKFIEYSDRKKTITMLGGLPHRWPKLLKLELRKVCALAVLLIYNHYISLTHPDE
ncbi:MAG: reverse transcriptase family protein [Pseudobdellovibrionaceae bacterium]